MGPPETKPCACCDERCPPGLIAGVLAIGIGTLLLLGNLHVLNVLEASRYWPLLLILIGALMLWRNLRGQTAGR